MPPLALDVTDRVGVDAAIAATRDRFGVIDVVVNNAGYGLFGAVEEISEHQLRDQLEVNLFGVFHVTQAVVPVMRRQGHGHIIQISTIGGIGAFPNLAAITRERALEGLTESLAQEVAGIGIKGLWSSRADLRPTGVAAAPCTRSPSLSATASAR